MTQGQWYGYTGFILNVDLSDGTVRKAALDPEWADLYLGGKGLGAKILTDRLPGGCAPLSPENILIFTTGPLTGTLVPTSGRFVVCTKSPATGYWLDSNCGGSFGPELKMAGLDAVVVQGRAAAPVVVVVDEGDIRIQPATDLWGLDVFAVHRWVKTHLGADFRVLTIGEAGEKGVLFANIISEYRALGRGGAGAVMGAKNLKAIAVRGTGSVAVADPQRFMIACREAYNELAIDPEAGGGRQDYGTNVILSCMNEAGIHPVRNFQKGRFAGSSVVNEENIRSYYIRNRACFGCPIYCSKISEVKEGPYRGTLVEGPEYEDVWSFGAHCENTDIGAIIQAEYLCDYYGLDGVSAGNVVGFLMECVEKGLIKEADLGFSLRFGDAEGMIEAVHLIGKRQGPGTLWGEGVRRIAEAVPGAEEAAMHVKGLELPAYDPRGSTGMALAYATSDRGGCHLRAWPIGAELLSTENRLDPFSPEYKAEFIKSQQDLFAVLNAIGICLFTTSALGMRQITQFLHSSTGRTPFASSEDILRAGERINNLVRLFNLREGLTAEEDTLPRRFMREPLQQGPCRGRVVDLAPLLREYYLVRGWNDRGVPTPEKLQELELAGEVPQQ
jgi:aldehyde:ferredoxin oxidoreductase